MPKPQIVNVYANENQSNLLILNSFTSKLLTNDLLTAAIKQDALKIINNLKYIKLNLDYISYCVDNKNDKSVYKYSTDIAKGVLRDPDGTSFHLNSYHNGAKAKADLGQLVQNFEVITNRLLNDNSSELAFLCIATAFVWDGETGCIEARTCKVFEKAAAIQSMQTMPDELLAHIFTSLYIPTCEKSLTVEKAANNFIIRFSLDQTDKSRLLKYLEDILSMEATDLLGIGEPAVATNNNGPQTLLQNSLRVILGATGTMIQVHFDLTKVEAAEAFVTSVQADSRLQNLKIHKANINFEKYQGSDLIIVRLTLQQAEILNIKPSSATTRPVMNSSTIAQVQTNNNSNNGPAVPSTSSSNNDSCTLM